MITCVKRRITFSGVFDHGGKHLQSDCSRARQDSQREAKDREAEVEAMRERLAR